MELRDYQKECDEKTESGWKDYRRQLVVAATGAGKTIIFSAMAKRMADAGNRTLILAHRDELITQAVDKLRKSTGIFAAVEQGGRSAMPGHAVTVASVQTLSGRLGKYAPDHFDMIICDEGHRSVSDEWQTILKYFDPCPRILAVTATPGRRDKKQLGQYYQHIPFEVGMLELVRRKYLCPFEVKRMRTEIDLSALRRVRGDVSAEDAAEAIHPFLAALAKDLAADIWDRKALVFLPRRDVSDRFAAALRASGIDARHISGASCDRAEILKWYAQPGPKALCNAMLLTEGFDQPDVNSICCLRPTDSASLYAQIIGRGTRLSPETGKTECYIHDPLWLTGQHDICRPACLTGGSELHQEKLQDALDLGMDWLEAEEKAKTDAEAALVKKLKEAAKKTPKGWIDAGSFAAAIHAHELLEWEPIMLADAEPVTIEQASYLAGVKIWSGGMERVYASMLIRILKDRKAKDLSSPKQVLALARLGEPNAFIATADQAGRILVGKFQRRK